MASDSHVSRSKESTYGAKLVDDVESHAGVHIGPTISSYININSR